MWESGNLCAHTGSNNPMAPYHTMMHKIHVLLVDHDADGLRNTTRKLEICQYTVSLAELASNAVTMLISGKYKFDVLIADINSPDLHSFKLLQHAVSMGLPTILMANEDDTYLAMRALQNGAFLCIKKPATLEMLKCLWQHVLREKTRTISERDMFAAAIINCRASRGIEFREVTSNYRPQQNPNSVESMTMIQNNGKFKRKTWGRDDIDEYELKNNIHRMIITNNVKTKVCTEWTDELHAKFLDAVERLGEGKCFPKEILGLMNVPGLTRMQVASHLQKCRNDNWRSPQERKAQQHTQHDPNVSMHKPRRFGSKPELVKTHSGPSHGPSHGSNTQSDPEMPTPLIIETPMSMTNASNHQPYGPFEPGPSNAAPGSSSSLNPGHSCDEFFAVSDVDGFMHNLPGFTDQVPELNHPNPCPGRHEQNSAGPRKVTKGKWSSNISSNYFESVKSESKSQEE